MSLYHFLAADRPLEEVDYSGFTEMTVRDIKQMNPVPEPPEVFESWDELDEDEIILYAEDEETLGGLSVTMCDKPPSDVKKVIKKPYIYWVEGNFEREMTEQLLNYIKQHADATLEFWTIWLGDGDYEPVQERISLEQLTVEYLVSSAHRDCHCIVLT